jgi:hypothetical protein
MPFGIIPDSAFGFAGIPTAGTFPNCPMIGGVGYFSLHIRFPDTSLAALASKGGSITGRANYTATGANVQKCAPT